MDGDREFNLHWGGGEVVVKHDPDNQAICNIESVHSAYSNMTPEEIMANTDQMAAENLMFLAQDVIGYTETAELADDPSVECVTEEVVTDDWVVDGGQERVEVPIEHLANSVELHLKEENDVDVPLPTDQEINLHSQDEYTAMRPWPCDFCSRRFRKKAALMNHMVAHQNDRPHACNLCGVRYVRKCDLMNHLKVHAFVPDNADSVDFEELLENNQIVKPKKKRGRRKKIPEPEEAEWENMTSARTQQWSRRGRSPAKPPPSPPPPMSPPSPPSPPSPQSVPSPSPPPPPADPSRPFVCQTCGIGFARQKALQSHARVHGGDSPIDCGECGELCWSREALATHAQQRHPNLPPRTTQDTNYNESDSGDDMDFRLSPESAPSGGVAAERPVYDTIRGPELFCPDCGVAFQRADLLRRHVTAAHSYKRRESGSGTWTEHTCDVCGEACSDALQLLAHAELHHDRPRAAAPRLKKSSKGRNSTTISSNSRQFPCRECGKVFGSRSSQQIHIRIHTGERPYACRFCWKAFADGGTLRKHERIHTGEKPYACAVCPRAFNQRVVLREHVRSHHSAPDRRQQANGGAVYSCVVCSRSMHTSVELVQHLIQHCDANTALKRQPQNGPRKYKRRRKIKSDLSPVRREWATPSPRPQSPSPSPPQSPPPSPPPVRRRSRREPPPPRPRMIHTSEEPRAKTKQVKTLRQRRPPRHPADDLRAIGAHSPSPNREVISPVASPQHDDTPDAAGPYKCEMCSMEFPRRDALLLHVPVHI